MNLSVAANLAQTIAEVHPEGAAWLQQFPALVAGWQGRWRLTLGAPFANLSYHYVAPGRTADGQAVVLKAGPPGMEFRREAAALTAYGGRGAVRLLHADLDQGAMLLAQVQPGSPLLALEDDAQATEIAAGVMQRLWQAAPALPSGSSVHAGSFPTVAEWGQGLERYRRRYGDAGPLSARLVDKAQAVLAELLESMAPPVLLHGDLHHENILAGRDAQGELEWLAIDPKGVWGEPAYETGAWLRNPMSKAPRWATPQALLARRLDLFADRLGMERARMAGWGFAQAMLSACWTVEDHPPAAGAGETVIVGLRHAQAVAEWLEPML